MLKTTTNAAIALGAILCIANPVQASERFYISGNFTVFDYEEEKVDVDASLQALGFRSGLILTNYFSVEFRSGFGVKSNNEEVAAVDIKLEMDYYVGAYARGGINITNNFFPYVAVGYTHSEFSGSVPNIDITTSNGGGSLGVGYDVNLTDHLILNVEYMNHFNTDEVDLSGFTIGLGTSF